MPVTASCSAVGACRRPSPLFRGVVIIGNGPSAITLSFMLAGNRPHYNGKPVSDPFLQERLDSINKDSSLFECNLEELSEGLSGRSRNPISVLYDAMARPDADLGLSNPSAIDWTYCDDRAISHVVIGKGKPGGAWHAMDGDILTLSFGTWMELPDSDFSAFCGDELRAGRPTVSTVAKYYENFVEEKQLSPFFLDHSVVTCVRRVFLSCQFRPTKRVRCDDADISDQPCSRPRSSSVKRSSGLSTTSETTSTPNTEVSSAISPALDPRRRCISVCSSLADTNEPEELQMTYLWEVRGYRETVAEGDVQSSDEDVPTSCPTRHRVPFHFVTPNLVLATGTTDSPNKLGVPGEDLPFVTHSLAGVEEIIADPPNSLNGGPLIVIGAGLTAADAIVAALAAGVDVYHVFRRDPLDPRVIFNNLPASLYPEYHRVHALMTKRRLDPHYKSFPKCNVIAIRPSGHVLLECENGCGKFKAGAVAALIGSRPSLDFMGRLKNRLGVVPGVPLDGKVNVFDSDPYTHESNTYPGLYALGPLAGDNFVRFLQGGALAVAASINRKRMNQLCLDKHGKSTT